jgi:hypothetical protein
MMTGMSKPKKTDKPAAEKPVQKGRGTVFNIRLGHEREALLAEYIALQDVAPDKSAVILKAFDEFMARRGLPKSKE